MDKGHLPPSRTALRAAKQQPRRSVWKVALATTIGAAAVIFGVVFYASPFESSFPVLVVEEAAESQSLQSEPVAAQSEPEPEPKQPVTFTLVAGGDVLTHIPVANSAWNGESYEFSRLMQPVSAYLEGADLALCNMEVPVGEPGAAPTGFPIFSAPYETPAELVKAGWDGCSTSSNQSVDQGYAGLVRTLESFDAAGLGHVGTARSQEESDSPQHYQIEKDGETLTVAHLAFAHNLNGLDFPSDAPWAINLNDTARIITLAQQAREDGADLVVVSYHCCEAEYISYPEQQQIDVANDLAASGLVDIMIGHHAHVPQPVELLEGGPTGEGMWVAYGTGNFISNQSAECCVEQSSSGALIYFDVVLDPDGEVTVPEASWTAITLDREYGHVMRVITAQGSEGASTPQETLVRRHSQVAEVIGTVASERTEAPTTDGTTRVVPRNR